MKISILIPIFNVEKYIERCARSLFEQTYSDIDFIFVNDCTPDNSVEILKNIIQDYPQRKDHVRIIKHKTNRGLAAARNTAVENCQTEFLMHMDSDDYLEKDAIEKLVKKQFENNYDIVTGNAMMHYKDTSKILRVKEPTDKKDLINLYIKTVYNHVVWGRLIRTSLYKDNNILALTGCNIGEDHQVTPRLFYYAKNFTAIDDVIYHYDCTNENSYMNQQNTVKAEIREICNTKSFNVLRLFFKDKDPDFHNQVYKNMPIVLEKALHYSTINNHKENHNEMAKLFHQLDRHLLKQVGFSYSLIERLSLECFLFARSRYIISTFYHIYFK